MWGEEPRRGDEARARVRHLIAPGSGEACWPGFGDEHAKWRVVRSSAALGGHVVTGRSDRFAVFMRV